jgi:hypothetical protein
MKQLIAVLSICSFLPLAGNAASSCRGALLSMTSSSLSETQIDETLTSFARLKLNVDLAKVSGSKDLSVGTLRIELATKKRELLQELNISESELQTLVAKKIAALQGLKYEEAVKEHQARAEEAEARLPYKLSQTLESVLSYSDYFIPKSNKYIVHYSARHYYAVDFATKQPIVKRDALGTILVGKMESLLLYREGQVTLFDMNTLKEQGIKYEAHSNEALNIKDNVTFALSPDQQSFVIYDFKRFYSFDIMTGKLLASGEFRDLPAGKFNLEIANHNAWILSFDNSVFKFNPTTAGWTRLINTPNRAKTLILADKSKFLVANEKELSIYDLNSSVATATRLFDKPISALINGANSDALWVMTEKGANQFSVNTLDLKDHSDPVKPQKNLSLANVISTEQSKYYLVNVTQNRRVNSFGLYTRQSFEFPVFNFLGQYDAPAWVFDQRMSSDGSRIFVSYKLDEQVYIDIWERP